MHTVTMFPLGSADCCRIDLAGGQKILFDYANTRNADDPGDKRIDRAGAQNRPEGGEARFLRRGRIYPIWTRTTSAEQPEFFFELRHASKCQGGSLSRSPRCWVPAAAICEERSDLAEEGRVIQAEARYRLRKGEGIRVFSRPRALEAWLRAQGLTLESRAHLLTDAGQLVPGFSRSEQGVEFFVHSPFATRQNDDTFDDRNMNSLVMQAVFGVLGRQTKVILAADTTHDVWTEIVPASPKFHNRRPARMGCLQNCRITAATSLGPEKGKEKTEPVEAFAG